MKILISVYPQLVRYLISLELGDIHRVAWKKYEKFKATNSIESLVWAVKCEFW